MTLDERICAHCGAPLVDRAGSTGRKAAFCCDAHRVAHHRASKRNSALEAPCNDLRGQLVLELFPGGGLFGRAFESLGATVVRGHDILWGGDVRCMRGIPGRFDGIIGGPPCQTFSKAAISGSKRENLIPEFVRLVDEFRPKWAVMENVREAAESAPEWARVFVRDWDCGGHTHRARGFWFYGLPAPKRPARRDGTPEYSVLASSWNNRKGKRPLKGHTSLTASRAAQLQGYPDLADAIKRHQPGWLREDGRWDGVNERSREVMAVHMLGNGVPYAMGVWIARWVASCIGANAQKEG